MRSFATILSIAALVVLALAQLGLAHKGGATASANQNAHGNSATAASSGEFHIPYEQTYAPHHYDKVNHHHVPTYEGNEHYMPHHKYKGLGEPNVYGYGHGHGHGHSQGHGHEHGHGNGHSAGHVGTGYESHQGHNPVHSGGHAGHGHHDNHYPEGHHVAHKPHYPEAHHVAHKPHYPEGHHVAQKPHYPKPPCNLPECNIIVKNNNYLNNSPTEKVHSSSSRPLRRDSRRHSLLNPIRSLASALTPRSHRSHAKEGYKNKEKTVVIQD